MAPKHWNYTFLVVVRKDLDSVRVVCWRSGLMVSQAKRLGWIPQLCGWPSRSEMATEESHKQNHSPSPSVAWGWWRHLWPMWFGAVHVSSLSYRKWQSHTYMMLLSFTSINTVQTCLFRFWLQPAQTTTVHFFFNFILCSRNHLRQL